jgi:hypothetical protein
MADIATGAKLDRGARLAQCQLVVSLTQMNVCHHKVREAGGVIKSNRLLSMRPRPRKGRKRVVGKEPERRPPVRPSCHRRWQRRRLAAKAKRVGPVGLFNIPTLVTPHTLLRWYRTLIAKKYDGTIARRPGRPKTAAE